MKASEDDRLALLEFALPLPGGFDWLAPVVAKDKTTGRVYLATQLALVRSCLERKNALGSSDVFRRAMVGLPERGNGLSYTSPQLTEKIRRIVESYPSAGAEEKRIVQVIIDLVLPTLGVPTAAVTTQLADGVYTASNSTSSHKESLLLVQYPMALGILSAVAIPAFMRYRDRATEVQASQN